MSNQNTNSAVVSIIIVTYNAAKTLQACLDSVFGQTYPHIQIIVIDGKSTDGTTEIIEANAAKLYYHISEPDTGIYDAMNKGIAQATGDYIYFLGADDDILPDFSKMANELTDPATIYYGSVLTRGLKPLGPVSTYYLAKHGIIQQSIIYPKAVFKKYSYNLKYKTSADYALNMASFNDKAFKLVYLDYTIANFADTGASGQSLDLVFEKDKAMLVLKNFGFRLWVRFLVRRAKDRRRARKHTT
ncbi:glycosyltransferase [Mucilaginibacter sp. HMF5004]|uniref:glycosyltransferase family 2 protein n=1 Tax=Mucilaginibacter rivuli TaxID=2857527 RepID=UPI001C5DCBED|nr:glycosyltransferase family 2 protein [Mucilaginibacter rivuli]MBW4888439.1 glycosyltransferase [Mucilaginibacter rivuli]